MKVLEFLKSFFLEKLDSMRQRNKLYNDAIQALLRNELVQIYKASRTAGGADWFERENFEMLYQQYKILGGNGFIEHIKEQFEALPLIEN